MMSMTTRAATVSDAAAIAALWNAKAADPHSCFFEVPAMDAAGISNLIHCGNTFAIAEKAGLLVGFASWVQERFRTIAANDSETYYRLLLAFANDNTSVVATQKAPTTELNWLSALSTVRLTPIGFDPIAASQPLSDRVPRLYQISVPDLAASAAELTQLLGGAA